MVKSLIFGHVTHDPYAFLFNNDCGLLRPEELALVRNEDEQALLTSALSDVLGSCGHCEECKA